MDYIPRLIDSVLEEYLDIFGAIVIEGPRGAGKTTAVSRVSKSVVRMQDPVEGKGNHDLAKLNPHEILKGETPLAVDEWQECPEIWDAARIEVDNRREPGQFILVGSAAPDRSRMKHCGAGRMCKLRMGTMSLFESGDSTGEVSLRALFAGGEIEGAATEKKAEDIAEMAVRGGWPAAIGKSGASARKLVKSYCDAIAGTDISYGTKKRRRDARKVRALMKSLSKSVSMPLSKASLLKGMAASGAGVSENTLSAYLDALMGIYVLEPLPAWHPSLRSETPVRSACTVHFCDPSIPACFLRASPEGLLTDICMFKVLFNSMTVRDLRAYARALNGDLLHYRDKNGLEADAVICLDDGRWAAIDMRLGDSWIDEAAADLLKLKEKVNTDAMGEPAFLAVITATRYAYTRPDGVHVIPIALLGP